MFECFKKKYKPYYVYLEIVSNKWLDSLKTLQPPPTQEEREILLKIFDELSPDAQCIIYYTCIDNGAGTGIDFS